MIEINDKTQEVTIKLPRIVAKNGTNTFTLTLKSQATGQEYITNNIVDANTDFNYYVFNNVDFSNIPYGYYEYELTSDSANSSVGIIHLKQNTTAYNYDASINVKYYEG